MKVFPTGSVICLTRHYFLTKPKKRLECGWKMNMKWQFSDTLIFV